MHSRWLWVLACEERESVRPRPSPMGVGGYAGIPRRPYDRALQADWLSLRARSDRGTRLSCGQAFPCAVLSTLKTSQGWIQFYDEQSVHN